MPAVAGNAAQGWGEAPHPQQPTTGARRGEHAEGGLPQWKSAGLIARRGSHQVEGYVEELQTLTEEARASALPWAEL